MATTQLRLDHDKTRMTAYATGHPLMVDLYRWTRKGKAWSPSGQVMSSPAHVRELLADGWVATGDVEAFFASVAAGASDDPFAGVSD